MEYLYTGSTWKKWDMHVHTPISLEQQYGGDGEIIWENYISDLEGSGNECAVIGINDYFTIDGFKKVSAYKNSGRLIDKTIFPVIELRIKAFGGLGDDRWQKVNLHVIFDNDNIQDIEDQFLKLLPIDFEGIFSRVGVTLSTIESLGQAIIDKSNGKLANEKPIKLGFANLNFDHRVVYDLLKRSGLKYFTAIGKVEWDTLRWTGCAAEKLDIANRSDFFFTASKSIPAYNKSFGKLQEQFIRAPLLDCSDAHHLSNKLDKNGDLINERIGNSNTWIKSDLTFEGLRQVIFEPKSRLYVSDTVPATPLNHIQSVNFSFPANTKIYLTSEGKGKNNVGSAFCINNLNLSFSPHFTCLIGGRGSGKSTILNFIASQLGCNDEYLDKNSLKIDNTLIRPSELKNFITIKTTCNDVEYISQNEIERYAHENSEQLTQAIYDRLLQSNEEEIRAEEELIVNSIETIHQHIVDIKLYQIKYYQKQDVQKDIQNFKAVVTSLDSEEYKRIVKDIENATVELNKINIAQNQYKQLLINLEALYINYEYNKLSANDYEIELESTYNKMREIFQKNADFSEVNSRKSELIQIIESLNVDLKNYLLSKNIGLEDIKDYERAFKQLPIAESTLSQILIELGDLEEKRKDYAYSKLSSINAKDNLESKIISSINKLNSELKTNQSVNVSEIQFEYNFNTDAAEEELLDLFEVTFPDYRPADHSTRKDAVREYLLCVPPLEVNEHEVYLSALDNYGSNVKAKALVRSILVDKFNFILYKAIVDLSYINVLKHKTIAGYYGGRELRKCSFGQRCTAVIVALLMFGNKPIIIDEPEAHLDSKLIAEYLVDLIKKRKINRQIIFATHNANFVINGDAELIHVLSLVENLHTTVVSTSIENEANRHLLLQLEGNREAFERREKKLIG